MPSFPLCVGFQQNGSSSFLSSFSSGVALSRLVTLSVGWWKFREDDERLSGCVELCVGEFG